MKDFWKRKRNKRIAASALAVVMAGFLVWGLFPWQAAAAKNTVADNVTINKWQDTLDNSTKNVGRIWTDKSVSKGDVKLTETDKSTGEPKNSATIKKNGNSDFLVGLSALSSTAKIIGQTTVPLDIRRFISWIRANHIIYCAAESIPKCGTASQRKAGIIIVDFWGLT